MQERRNSIANALELGLSCNNPSISHIVFQLENVFQLIGGYPNLIIASLYLMPSMPLWPQRILSHHHRISSLATAVIQTD